MERETRKRSIRTGEALALDPKAVHSGRDAFFWLWSAPTPRNERVGEAGTLAVVHVRGPLEHHDDWGESYESIKARLGKALTGEDVVEREDREARWNGREPEQRAPTPPAAVILRIDSPGGVVSGLTETVLELRRMGANAGIPLIAYVDEMATSAAYALACACDEIYLPPSAIAGSIGVISTMAEQSAADEDMGFRFSILTSGARKADGHPHVPISDAAIAAEQKRVDTLAGQFFKLVAGARPGLTVAKIRRFEAGLFLGAEAVDAGIADGVMSWDEVVGELARAPSGKTSGRAGLVESPKAAEASMLKIRNLIASAKAKLSATTDLGERKKLTAEISHYEATLDALDAKKTVKTVEYKERETSDDGGDKDDEKDDDEEASAEAEGSKADDDDEGDEEASAEGEESSTEAAAAPSLRTALAAHVKDDPALLGQLDAVLAKAERLDKMSARIVALEKAAESRERATLIEAALTGRNGQPDISPAMAAKLRERPLAYVKSFLQDVKGGGLVISSKDALARPRGAKPGADGKLSDDLEAMIARAIEASDGQITREQVLADWQKSQNGASSAGSY